MVDGLHIFMGNRTKKLPTIPLSMLKRGSNGRDGGLSNKYTM
jgi:hypothetical protein